MIRRATVCAAGLVLAYLLLAGWPQAWPPVMRACCAVLALAAGVAVWTWRSAAGDNPEVSVRKPGTLDFAAAAGALLALECGFLWLLFAAPGPLESAGLVIERVLRPEAAAMRTVSSSRGPVSGNWLWNEQTKRPLPRRTDFKPGRKPEVFIRLANPADAAGMLAGRVYVGAFALGFYQDSAWSPLPGVPVMMTAEDSGFTRVAAPRPGTVIEHDVFHAKDPASRTPLTALQGVTEVFVSPLERIDDGLHLLPEPNDDRGYRYTARSASRRIEDLPDDALLRAWPGARAELLEIPDAASYRELPAMARAAAGTGSTKEQLLRLQKHLRESFQYSLETGNPRDLDPMENFLFHEKRGHCEFFATAGALMARALGIPSRVAYGWAGGTWYEASGLFVFRANEAHAWTELWLEGHGWVIMDPTPQARGEETARAAAPGEKPPLAETEDTTEESADPEVASSHSKLPFFLAALTIPVALGLMALRRRDRKRGFAGEPDPGYGSRKPPGYLGAWRGAAAASGHPWRPGVTLKHHVRSMPDTPDFAAELVAYHYTTTYEAGNPDATTERRLTRRIQAWRQTISGINAEPGSSEKSP